MVSFKLKILKILLSISTLYFFCAIGFAQNEQNVANIPLNECEHKKVFSMLLDQTKQKEDQLTNETAVVTNQILALGSNDKNQPSVEQRNKLAELGEKMINLQIRKYVESIRQRDIAVIEDMLRVTIDGYAQKEKPSANTKDAFLESMLNYLTDHTSDVDDVTPTTTVCSADYALYVVEKKMNDELNAQIDALSKETQAILDKNNIKKMDDTNASSIPALDKLRLLAIRSEMLKINETINIVSNMESIRAFSHVSDMIYQSYQKDISMNKTDSNLGATLQNMIDKKEVNEDTQLTIKIWKQINEKIPSNMEPELKKLNIIIKEKS